MADANCRGMDPNAFHPKRGLDVTPETKRVCAQCAVIDPCREMAVNDWKLIGYWGGTSDRERRTIRKRHNQLQESA
jgi:WhiB family transcriptional regulator, redox-sensing transcriptional regulator